MQSDTLASLARDKYSSLNTTLLRQCVSMRRAVYKKLTTAEPKSQAAKKTLYKWVQMCVVEPRQQALPLGIVSACQQLRRQLPVCSRVNVNLSICIPSRLQRTSTNPAQPCAEQHHRRALPQQTFKRLRMVVLSSRCFVQAHGTGMQPLPLVHCCVRGAGTSARCSRVSQAAGRWLAAATRHWRAQMRVSAAHHRTRSCCTGEVHCCKGVT